MTETHDHSSSIRSPDRTLDNLTPEELIQLREAFRIFDQDGDVRKLIDRFFE